MTTAVFRTCQRRCRQRPEVWPVVFLLAMALQTGRVRFVDILVDCDSVTGSLRSLQGMTCGDNGDASRRSGGLQTRSCFSRADQPTSRVWTLCSSVFPVAA